MGQVGISLTRRIIKHSWIFIVFGGDVFCIFGLLSLASQSLGTTQGKYQNLGAARAARNYKLQDIPFWLTCLDAQI